MSGVLSTVSWGSGKQGTAKSASLPFFGLDLRDQGNPRVDFYGAPALGPMGAAWYELPGQAPVDTGWLSYFYVFLSHSLYIDPPVGWGKPGYASR